MTDTRDDFRGGLGGAEPAEFAAAFRRFLDWVHSAYGVSDPRNEVTRLIADYLGAEGMSRSVVSRELPPFEHVNLQTAVDAWSAQPGRTVQVRGMTVPPHYAEIGLQQLISGVDLPPLLLSAPALVDLSDGPHSTLACLKLALLLVADARGRYVVMVQGPSENAVTLQVEVAGIDVDAAQEVLGEIDRLRLELNVYRGHLLDASIGSSGDVVMTFVDPPHLERGDVVLPEAVLQRIERHSLAFAAARETLLGLGQHLKRGLLLYGPPGTGKTHSTRYLLRRMTGYTRLVLTGRSLMAVGPITALARDLAPAVVVLEDVDLIAEERTLGMDSSPVLFDLLDAMDGAAPDADLMFLLTTNRADLLEPALAARPGRVDVAVHIDLPDPEARAALFALYSRNVPMALTEHDIRIMVERTEGVTASFLKELVRRAVLEALQDDPELGSVTGAHVGRALDDLLDSAQDVTRSLLGVGNDPSRLPPSGRVEPMPDLQESGWFGRMPRRYREYP